MCWGICNQLVPKQGRGRGQVLGDDIVHAFFIPSSTAENVISKDVMYVVAAGAWCVGGVNGKSEFASDV